MDADDLDRRGRTGSDRIPPELVGRLLERGHTALVAERAAREWPCADAWARMLAGEGRPDEALEVLAPHAATGRWDAVVAVAELLEDTGRVAQAIETVRARMSLGHPHALKHYARLLARHGRAGEAFDLLLPYADEYGRVHALAEVAAAAGREEETAALLDTRIAEHRCTDFPWCCDGFDTDTARELLAGIRERQGRIDEAIALLRRRHVVWVNGRDLLADLLARHGRYAEALAYAKECQDEEALEPLARALEERGDVEGAIAVYRQEDLPASGHPNAAYEHAQLLARHGRGEEAIAVLREQADRHPDDDWLRHALAVLCLEQGFPAEGLAHLEALAARCGGGAEEWGMYRIRLPLLAARDGVDAAVRQARAHPEGDTPCAAADIARLLADAGRAEEALAVLDQHAVSRWRLTHLAGRLIDLGRTAEALALLQRPDQPAF
ncbi:tetratricopeptide repeat protein [Kitasatospora sp. NPDC057198]|uniref:tetratricopeptide repeat protein n=1 Tax=Kitasatospora sp. NPDC057198 TaxID=3346046 RepID=UPI0036344158